MDPDTNLSEQRRICGELDVELNREPANDELIATLASELVDLVQGVDQWMAKGGFTPHAWLAGPRVAVGAWEGC